MLLLHNHLGDWYAVCHDHETGEVRDFHAGRITNITNTRRTFTPPEGFAAEEKGVEHSSESAVEFWQDGEDSNDAERR